MAWASIGVNVALSLLNLAIAAASGSLAVAAEMVHNLVDLVASVAVLAGVKISERESRAFPYGLYEVENVVALGVAILIFFTGYEIAQQAIRGGAGPVTVNGWILAGVALSALLPLAFSVYQMRMGRALNSPSLMASAWASGWWASRPMSWCCGRTCMARGRPTYSPMPAWKRG